MATREFAKSGLNGASINVISELTKTSKRMIYYYFGGKNGLYHAVIDANYQRIREAESHLDLEALTPIDALTALISVSFDFHSQNPDFVRLIMVENLHNGAHTRGAGDISERNMTAIDTLRGIYQRGVADGVMRGGIDPIGLHLTISALCFHYISNRETFSALFDYDMKSPTALAVRRQAVIDVVVRYVRQ
ncbi:MAG: TetR family transcriptional regulator [Alphaproteobacteria bacterium]|nr:TetR family transcriptional regulator [Alphaproteobacteria bacterium]